MASTSKIRGVEVLASSGVQGECKTRCLTDQDEIIRLYCHIAVVYNAKNNLCAGLFSQVAFFLLPLQCVLDWRNKQSLSQAGLAHLENNVLITIPSPWNPSPFQPEPGSLSFEATLCRVPRCYGAPNCRNPALQGRPLAKGAAPCTPPPTHRTGQALIGEVDSAKTFQFRDRAVASELLQSHLSSISSCCHMSSM